MKDLAGYVAVGAVVGSLLSFFVWMGSEMYRENILNECKIIHDVQECEIVVRPKKEQEK